MQMGRPRQGSSTRGRNKRTRQQPSFRVRRAKAGVLTEYGIELAKQIFAELYDSFIACKGHAPFNVQRLFTPQRLHRVRRRAASRGTRHRNQTCRQQQSKRAAIEQRIGTVDSEQCPGQQLS